MIEKFKEYKDLLEFVFLQIGIPSAFCVYLMYMHFHVIVKQHEKEMEQLMFIRSNTRLLMEKSGIKIVLGKDKE